MCVLIVEVAVTVAVAVVVVLWNAWREPSYCGCQSRMVNFNFCFFFMPGLWDVCTHQLITVLRIALLLPITVLASLFSFIQVKARSNSEVERQINTVGFDILSFICDVFFRVQGLFRGKFWQCSWLFIIGWFWGVNLTLTGDHPRVWFSLCKLTCEAKKPKQTRSIKQMQHLLD